MGNGSCGEKVIRHKAQSTLEFCVFTAVVIAALLAMTIYLKRAVQGKLREAADSVGEQYSSELTVASSQMQIESNVDSNSYVDETSNAQLDSNYLTDTATKERTIRNEYEETPTLDSENLF
jgi:hypothetical protein